MAEAHHVLVALVEAHPLDEIVQTRDAGFAVGVSRELEKTPSATPGVRVQIAVADAQFATTDRRDQDGGMLQLRAVDTLQIEEAEAFPTSVIGSAENIQKQKSKRFLFSQ